MVIHLDLAKRLVTNQKSDIQANCCGAQERYSGYVSFPIPKHKKLAEPNIVAF
jgi:hypothetical protein